MNIGPFLKVIGFICIIAGVIAMIVLWAAGKDFGFGVAVGGGSMVASAVLYAIGQMTDDIRDLHDQFVEEEEEEENTHGN